MKTAAAIDVKPYFDPRDPRVVDPYPPALEAYPETPATIAAARGACQAERHQILATIPNVHQALALLLDLYPDALAVLTEYVALEAASSPALMRASLIQLVAERLALLPAE